MKERISKIWKDPVWSKVIAAVIIASPFTLYSWIEGISIKDTLIIFYNFKVRLFFVLIFLLCIWIITLIVKAFKKPKTFTSPSTEIRKLNRTVYSDIEILARWTVGVGQVPFVRNLELYCNKHETPMKLMSDTCPVADCRNPTFEVDEEWIENDIESLLRQKWDELNENQ